MSRDMLLQFLDDLRVKKESVLNKYVYGWDRKTATSPFLFWSDRPDAAQVDLAVFNDLSEELMKRSYSRNYIADGVACSAYAMAEIHSHRVSLDNWQCDICKFEGGKAEVCEHIFLNHSSNMKDEGDRIVSYLYDDSVFMKGMYTKMILDGLCPIPSSLLLRGLKGFRGPIVAPCLEGNDEDDRSSQEIGDSSERSSVYDAVDSLGNRLKAPLFALYSDRIDQLAFGDKYIDLHDDSAYSFSPMECDGWLKVVNDEICKPKFRLEASAKQQILDSFPEEEEKSRKQRHKRPRTIPMSETIPDNIRSEVIMRVGRLMIATVARSICIDVVRPVLDVKKKEAAKKLKEEQINRAKQEELVKLRAIRKMRTETMSVMATSITSCIFKSFIMDEISKILEEETTHDQEQSAIVVTGLTRIWTEKSKEILACFDSFKLAKDSNGKPKIHYRIFDEDLEVIIYFRNPAEASKAMSSNSIRLCCPLARLRPVLETPNETHTVYTGQMIRLCNDIRHSDKIRTSTDSAFVYAMPVIDIRKYML